ncbi:hypothetical protein Tco_1344464 [Tanacetum coccineum]
MDATGYELKHDYTIIKSPRAVVFPVNNNEQKIMRFNVIYKFSNGTLTHILETLDYRVKEFKIKQLNPSMNTPFWTEKDVTRSKEFIAAIESKILRVLRIILVVLPEHPSDMKVLTMKMQILLEPTSNKLLCEHAGPKVTTSHGGNTTTRMIWRFTVADDLKECSKITQVKGTTLKDFYTESGSLSYVSNIQSPSTREQSGQPVMTREEDDGIYVALDPHV